VVKNNVFVVDSNIFALISTPDQLSIGVYVYTYKPTIENLRHSGDFANGGVMVGLTGEGYMRKIVSVTNANGVVTITTHQAKLEDVFETCALTFSAGVSQSAQNTCSFSYNNLTLFGSPTGGVVISSGTLSMNTLQNYVLNIQKGFIQEYSANCNNAKYSADLIIACNSTANTTVSAIDTIAKASSTKLIWLGKIPVVISTHLSVVANVSGTLNGNTTKSIHLSNTDSFSAGLYYAGGAWSYSSMFAPKTRITNSASTSGADLNVSINIVPQISVKLCGVPSRTLSLPLNTHIVGKQSATTADWNFNTSLNAHATMGQSVAVLGYSIPEYNYSTTIDGSYSITPYRMNKISGDGQTGIAGQYLPQAIIVQVVDNNGIGQPNVPVYFQVLTGGGSVSYSSIHTDANGKAPASWQFGFGSTPQTMQATARNADGTAILGAPAVFTAH
jgi:hypothetical protein